MAMDKEGELSITNKTNPTKRSEYIDVRHHYIQDATEQKFIRPYYKPSTALTADVMTKPLPTPIYQRHRVTLQIVPELHTATAAVVGMNYSAGPQ